MSNLLSEKKPPLHIFYDVTRLCRRDIRMSGISRYGRNVLKGLLDQAAEPGSNLSVTCVVSQVERLERSRDADLVGFVDEFGTPPITPNDFLAAVKDAKRDSRRCVYFSPYEELPDFSKALGVQRCITIHDLFHLERPDVYGYKFNNPHLSAVEKSLRDDDFIVTVSEFTRSRVISRFDHSPENVRSVHLAAEDSFAIREHVEVEEVKKVHGIGARYFMSLGQFDPRKNLGALVSSVSDALSKIEETVEFVLVASVLNQERTGDLVKQILGDNFSRVKIVTELSDNEFAALLSGAEFFLFPTLAEGFGLPIVEAFACGCPVITSSVTAMPEISMDAALYVDPMRPEQITNAIVSLSNSSSLRKSLKDNAERVSKRFRWANTADEILAYMRVMASNSSELIDLDDLIGALEHGPSVTIADAIHPNRAIRGQLFAPTDKLIGQGKGLRPYTFVDDDQSGVHAVEYLLPDARADESHHFFIPIRAQEGFSYCVQIYSSSSRKENDNQVTLLVGGKHQSSVAVETTHEQFVTSAEIGQGNDGWQMLHAHLDLRFAGERGVSILVCSVPFRASELKYKGKSQRVLECHPLLFGVGR